MTKDSLYLNLSAGNAMDGINENYMVAFLTVIVVAILFEKAYVELKPFLGRRKAMSNTATKTFDEVDFVPYDEWVPESDEEKQVKDYFGEQAIGKIGGINYPGYSEEKSIKLFHTDMSGYRGLLVSLKRILNGRRFYFRMIHSYENKYWEGKDLDDPANTRYYSQPLYKIRIFLE